MESSEKIIQKLERIRRENRLNQEDFAALMKLSRSTYNKAVQGEREFKFYEIVEISKEFNVDIMYFSDTYPVKDGEIPSMVKEDPGNYESAFGQAHPPQSNTLTISIDIPISGGLKIPEDITDQIVKLIKQNSI